MAFVNAWITQDDWDNPKYRLHELAARHPRVFLKPDKKCSWVIDRERNIYCTHIAMGGDREEWKTPGGFYEIWSMRWKESFTEIRLDNDIIRTQHPDDSTSVVWSFFGFEPRYYPPPSNYSEQQYILYLLKEALTIYGFAGMSIQRPNTIVTFTF